MLRDYWELFCEWIKSTLKSRVFWLAILCLSLCSILLVRLYQLQILNGAAYYDSYVSRTKKDILTPATRGSIYDRNGVLLAGNEAVYNLTIKDNNSYTKSNGEYNEMLLRLIHIVQDHGQKIVTELPVIIDEQGLFAYSGKESAIRQLIRDVYGTAYIESQLEKGVDVYSFDAETVMDRLMQISYNFTSKWEGAEDVSKEDALSICNVRYAMRSTIYSKYKSTIVCSDVSETLRAAILENQSELLGVEIEQSERRIYPDGIYFSNLLGYIGKPNSEELEALREEDSTYEATDMVGKDGLEQYYEQELAGTKGTDSVYLNNVGMILNTYDSVPSVRGNDIYLTIDADLTKAVYRIIEQRLADIIVGKLTIEDFEATDTTLASEFRISIKDVYYQVFANHVLNEDLFWAETASAAEQEIAALYDQQEGLVLGHILDELKNSTAANSSLSEDMQDYMEYVYTFLKNQKVILAAQIDTADETLKSWKAGELSLNEFLHYLISSGYIDSSRIAADTAYSSVENLYSQLLSYCEEALPKDYGFHLAIYRKLIDNELLQGSTICLALIDQGLLTASDSAYRQLQNSSSSQTAYDFIRDKIASAELSPAQLALDPCSGSAIVTDSKTGELLALVSYPGYDINRLSGTVDSVYWNQLIQDQSEPLYDKATQVRTAPGSTYKLITTAAGLEEGVISSDESITCIGIFDKLDNPRCWIARESGGMHGPLTTAEAIAQSCNFYFYEVGYRLSLNENGEYSGLLGLEKLQRYAHMFGLDVKSGVEIAENTSQLSTQYPVVSAIGQGTNNFTAISLARYVTALSNDGMLYQFRLLDRIEDSQGNVIEDINPVGEQITEISQNTFDVIAEGMYGVTHGTGTTANAFTGLQLDISGKSGSVQENLSRANHAVFMSYGPSADPEITVTVSIPHGYMAYNAAVVCRYVYQYYFGYIDMEDIQDKSYNTLGESVSFSD